MANLGTQLRLASMAAARAARALLCKARQIAHPVGNLGAAMAGGRPWATCACSKLGKVIPFNNGRLLRVDVKQVTDTAVKTVIMLKFSEVAVVQRRIPPSNRQVRATLRGDRRGSGN